MTAKIAFQWLIAVSLQPVTGMCVSKLQSAIAHFIAKKIRFSFSFCVTSGGVSNAGPAELVGGENFVPSEYLRR